MIVICVTSNSGSVALRQRLGFELAGPHKVGSVHVDHVHASREGTLPEDL